MADVSPYQLAVNILVPASAAAVDFTANVGAMAFAGFVRSVTYVLNAAIVGAALPNSRVLRVVNLGAGATGGGVEATANLDGSNNVAANAALAIPTAVPPNYTPRIDPSFNYVGENPNVGADGSNTYTPPVIVLTANSFQQGDVLQFQSTHLGTGVADPGGMLVVTVERAGNV